MHNFYIQVPYLSYVLNSPDMGLTLISYQNIRNNKNHKRTPKWAQRYGLVDTTKIERDKKRSEWAHRYNDRLPESTLEGQDLEEGEVRRNSDRQDSILEPEERSRQDNQYWNPNEEQYYGRNGNGSGSLDSGSNGGRGSRWRYPANFEDSVPSGEPGFYGDSGKYGDAPGAGSAKKKKKAKKDRWERTEDAYLAPEEPRKKKKSKKSKNRSTVGENGGDYVNDYDRRSVSSLGDGASGPENAEGGHYRGGGRRNDALPDIPAASTRGGDDDLNHEF